MLEKNKDYTIFTEYKDGKPTQLQVYMDEQDFQYWFKTGGVYRSNIYADFFNNCYSLYKDVIDNTLKEMGSENKEVKFEDSEYGIISCSDYFEFIIYAPDNLEFTSFEDFYALRDNWEKSTVATKEIIPVKDRIQAFKDHYKECYKKAGMDNRELDSSKDRSIFIPVLFEKDNELQEYLLFMDFIYYGYDDCEIDTYYYDCKNNRIYKGIIYYGNRIGYSRLFKPYYKINISQEGIENWYSFYESLISLYYTDKESFYFLYNKYINFFKEEIVGKDYAKYFTRKIISKFKPLQIPSPVIVNGKLVTPIKYIDK